MVGRSGNRTNPDAAELQQVFGSRFREGALAHLVERNVRNVKVRGSSPLCSTHYTRNRPYMGDLAVRRT